MEMLKTRQWWLLYVAFILTANTGLMIIAQLTRMGTFFRIKQAYIVLASAVFPVTNGVGRIFGGWVSDRFGRERTMSLFFATQGAFSILLLVAGSNEAAFVALISIIGLVYGPIFTFFPSIVADYYGRRSTMNYGITYTAKGWGGLLGGYITTLLSSAYGGFAAPIFASAVLSFAACILVSPKVLKRPTKS
jgi:OFA family oxalate/formate antiporter-like MFS transporter